MLSKVLFLDLCSPLTVLQVKKVQVSITTRSFTVKTPYCFNFIVFFFVFSLSSFTVVHRSEVIKNTLNPTWQPFNILGRVLCNGDYDRVIKFDVYDWDSDGRYVQMAIAINTSNVINTIFFFNWKQT